MNLSLDLIFNSFAFIHVPLCDFDPRHFPLVLAYLREGEVLVPTRPDDDEDDSVPSIQISLSWQKR